jgi:hypothetical protein
MKNFTATLRTDGSGYWSDVVKEVTTTNLAVSSNSADDHVWGELKVYFDTGTWDVDRYGLIYTDDLFLAELRAELNQLGYIGSDVYYSEQGMQGRDFVSLDVGGQFLDSWYAQ